MNNTMTYGMRKAPPPFSYAVFGNLQTLPRPTEKAMHDIRNSNPLPHWARSVVGSSLSWLASGLWWSRNNQKSFLYFSFWSGLFLIYRKFIKICLWIWLNYPLYLRRIVSMIRWLCCHRNSKHSGHRIDVRIFRFLQWQETLFSFDCNNFYSILFIISKNFKLQKKIDDFFIIVFLSSRYFVTYRNEIA